MSTRGGYGFVLNGQEKIIYVGNGAEFGSLGDMVLSWLRMVTAGLATNPTVIMEQIFDLKEVEKVNITADEVLTSLSKLNPAMRHVDPIRNYEWHSLMRQISYNPQNILNLGYYLDAAWMIDSVDCEYLYMVDFDKGMFEIYYDTSMARNLPASGRFNARTDKYESTTRKEAAYINMIISYPFGALPESVGHLEEDIYETEFWETSH